MSRCSPLRIFGLIQGSENRRNGCSDIITKQNRNSTCKTNDRMYSVRSRLRSDILQNRDGGRRTLHDECHAAADQHAENRNICHLPDRIRKNFTRSERLHDGTHRVNAEEKKSEAEDRSADCLHLAAFSEEIHKESGKDDDPDIITELECNELCCHRRADIGTENNRDGLRQSHKACAHKSDGHDRRRRGALQNRGDKGAGNDSHDRIDGEDTEDFLHPLAGCLLKIVGHHCHSIKEHRKSA